MARPEENQEAERCLEEDGGGRRDGEEDEDEGSMDDEEEEEDDGANMNPLSRLLKCANSSDYYDREMVARSIHETLRYVLDSPEDVATVLDVMASLSSNDEPTLRTDLMEQVPQIAFLCHDHPDKLGGLVTGNLVPMVVKYLTDPSDLVRKTSQAALLVLLEQELVSHKDVHDQVCPVILDLTEPDAIDDFKTEAVALMSKMAPLVGREMTERLFMERFTRLCSDTLFQVRKVCAANFGEFSGVVGTSCTESILLPHFVNLCEDGVWGVRKACADVFMVVSCACSLETRKKHLSPVFVSLLSDQSRWVRVAAFQNLGPFISTFADPGVTGLHYNDEGVLFIGTPPEANASSPLNADKILVQESAKIGKDSNCNQPDLSDTGSEINEDELSSVVNLNIVENYSEPKERGTDNFLNSVSYFKKEDFFTRNINTEFNKYNTEPFDASLTTFTTDESLKLCLDPLNDVAQYNEWNFWRVPLPDIDIIIEEEFTKLSHLENLDYHSENIADPSPAQERIQGIEPNSSLCTPEKSICDTTFETSVQAELEALAASLAESIFSSNDSVTTENSMKKQEEKEIKTDLKKNIPQESSSQESEFSLETKIEKEEEPVKKKLTYAEICVSNLKKDKDPDSIILTNVKCSTKIAENSTKISENSIKSAVSAKAEENEESTSNVSDCSFTFHPSPNSFQTYKKSEHPSPIGLHSMNWFSEGDKCNSSSLHNMTSFSNLTVLPSSPCLFELMEGALDLMDAGKSVKAGTYRDPQKSFNININQDIVPKTLLEHYISMTDPMRAEAVDNEITRHCAYSLPAVALTLGRRYWPVLRDTYETLAADMHWKVRRTLAFSIHELALILGEDLAQRDLLPVFEGFIKDLDEVRIGVLKHLAHFLKLLPPPHRKLFLPRLSEFLNPDNVNNWRFRLELSLQLAPISELFTAEECFRHICPVTFALMADKVAQIRRTCFVVVSQLARQLMTDNEETYILPFSRKLDEQFGQADTWTKRQSYVYVVGQFIKDSSVPLPIVCSLFLTRFLELARDKVPNIRLAIAKIINSSLLTLDYFHNPENEATLKIQDTLYRLKCDDDRDVQYFATYPVNSEFMLDAQDSSSLY